MLGILGILCMSLATSVLFFPDLPATVEARLPGGFDDCNGNGVDDATDIAGGVSQDCNSNGVPDECDSTLSFTELPVAWYYALDVAAGDLDGDGDQDAVFLTNLGVYWTENLGGGTWGNTYLAYAESASWQALLRVVDLGGDALPDILWRAGGELQWIENDGTGGFGTSAIVLEGLGAGTTYDLKIGDLDGNGDLDVVAARSSAIVWYRNLDGQLSPATIFPSPQGSPAVELTLGDLDRDSDLDVAFTQPVGGLSWLENADGDGGFSEARRLDAPGESPRDIEAADVDGDGDLDLLAVSPINDELLWYENVDGFGEEFSATSITVHPHFNLDVADLDGDRDPDVVLTSATLTQLSVVENLGAGAFGPLTTFDFGLTTWNPVAVDVNGDVHLDLLVVQGTTRVAWLRNENLDCDGDDVPDECEASCLPPGPPQCDIDCNANDEPDSCDIDDGTSSDCNVNGIPDECEPDCNGNGIADACDTAGGTSPDCNGNDVPDECEPDCNASGFPDGCDIASGASFDCDSNGTPDECDPDCNANGTPDDCDLASGTSGDCDTNGIPDECDLESAPDCNGNGVLDRCDVADGTADCNGNQVPDTCDLDDGTSTDCNVNTLPDECEIAGGSVPDCNRNGLPDSCDLDSGSQSRLQLIRCPDECELGVAFQPEEIYSTNSYLDAAPGDLDGDDVVDLAVGTWQGQILLFFNDGSGDFGAPTTIASFGSWPWVAVHDLDGDGDTDVLVSRTSQQTPLSIEWLENDGTGQGWTTRTIDNQSAGRPLPVDLAGDADPEVLVLVGGLDRDLVWYPNSGGQFGPAQLLIDPGTDTIVGVNAADLDGDGDNDVVAYLDEVLWLENLDGQGTFAAPQTIDPTYASRIFPRDVDGDGDVDLITSGTSSTGIAWLENLGGASAFQRHLIGPDDFANLVPMDFDRDGDIDVGVAYVIDDVFGWHENLDGLGSFAPVEILTPVPSPFRVEAVDVDNDGWLDLVSSYAAPSAGSPHSVDLLRGLPMDCDRNGVPDTCESDCDANGVNDACDLALGRANDCNANAVPDPCEAACPTCDLDQDGCVDEFDAAVLDAFTCSDVDADSCDDCTGGSHAPGDDGPDADADGACDPGDCAPTDAAAWTEPGAVDSLSMARSVATATILWSAPSPAGGPSLRYDTLRAVDVEDLGAAACLVTDGDLTSSVDAGVPAAGQCFFYLVRSENDCPGGTGSVGPDSAGQPRTLPVCP